ncbi:hypothetical protein HYDPIDRAFT_83282 [Hydnomerulius pinastri MD-312]|nr:hypothetical protein HYDPIDRAFT_83282 [Hydnomerulius pinastri MD-312]
MEALSLDVGHSERDDSDSCTGVLVSNCSTNDLFKSAPQSYTVPDHLASRCYGEAFSEEYDVIPSSLQVPSDVPSTSCSHRHTAASSHSSFSSGEKGYAPHPNFGHNPAPLESQGSGFTCLDSESLLFSSDSEYALPPSLPDFPAPIDSLLSPASELCSKNYSPHFPDGHYLDPAFVQKYLLGDELGSGGYGFVMTALHHQLKSEVAVKFVIKEKVPEQAWINDETLGRIPMEIMLLRIISHENIVKCLDLFEDELFFYVVQELHGSPWHKKEKSHATHHSSPEMEMEMEMALLSPSPPILSPAASDFSVTESEPETPPQICVQLSSILVQGLESTSADNILCNNSILPNKSPISPSIHHPHYTRRPSHDLFECIEQTKHKRLSEKQARYIMAQVVEAVHYLNSHGISHRDIKDENLVIDKDFKVVKLIDFGSATMVDPNEPRPFYKLFFGTTAYAASEVLLKLPYQAPPAEIWTLGVLMSYLLTGMSPFPMEEDAIEGRIVLSELPGKKLSSSCLHLMSRCLEPDPSLRADIEEVRCHHWLRGALSGL